MAVSFVLGSKLVGQDEYRRRAATGGIQRLAESLEMEGFESLAPSTPAVLAGASDARIIPDYEPIGIGKPLGIEILSMYTGDAPRMGIFGFRAQADLLVVSATKSVETFDAAARAVNQIIPSAAARALHQPSALRTGTAIVYYTPSLVTGTLLVSIELVADSFDRGLLDQVSGLLQTAAGIPVFMPASAYLLAGSVLTKIAGNLGDALLESEPFLRGDLQLRFDTPEIPISEPCLRVVHNDRHHQELARCTVERRHGADGTRVLLVDESGKDYAGDAPYLVVSINGKRRDELKEFSPTLASAAVLQKFYPKRERAATVVTELSEAMKLYNDAKFHARARELQSEMQGKAPNSDEYRRLKTLVDSYNRNIRTDVFRVPLPAGG